MERKNRRILLFQRIVPKYRIFIFEYLFRSLGIIVCYSKGRKDYTSSSLGFPSEKISRIFFSKSDTAIIQNPIGKLIKYKPDIIICEASTSYMTLWILVLCRIIFRYKLVVWSHGIKSHRIHQPFAGLEGRLKLFLFNTADAILIYSSRPRETLAKYVKVKDKIFIAQNSLDTKEMGERYKLLEIRGKDDVKSELGWKHKYNLIFVGRLLPSKGLTQIIEVFEAVSEELDVALHIVGDGPESQFVKLKSAECKRIYHYGAVYDEDKVGKLFFAADLLLMPKSVGLTIVNAFCYGCPIVSCENEPNDDSARHGPEFEYLIPGFNGIIVNHDVQKIALAIQELLTHEKIRNALSQNALTIKETTSLEKMAAGFHEVVKYLR